MKGFRTVLFWCMLFAVNHVFGQHVQFQRITTLNGLSNNTVLSIFQDKNGFMWFGTEDGLNRYDGYSFKIFKPDYRTNNCLTNTIIKVIFEDSQGLIWIGSDGGGLDRFDPVTEQFTNFHHITSDPNSISHDNITSIIEDKDKNLWVGTYGGGLNKYSRKTGAFAHYYENPKDKEHISSNYINCLLIDNANKIWIGTWAKGLDVLDPVQHSVRNYQYDEKESGSLPSNTVNCLLQNFSNQIWIGTWDGGVCFFDPKKGSFVRVSSSQNSKNFINIRSICQDPYGNLWLGSFGGGLGRLNPKTGIMDVFQNTISNYTSISNNNIWTTYCSKENFLWVGTIEGGINKLDLNKSKVRYISLGNQEGSTEQTTMVTSLCETKNGNIAIGTWDDGLYIFNAQLSSFIKYQKKSSEQSSLICNRIKCIFEDKYQKLWIGTEDGLSVFNPKTNTFKNYKQRPNNLKDIGISNINAVFEDKSGAIWIGTWGKGLNRYEEGLDEFYYYLAAKKSRVTFQVDMTGLKISPKGVHMAGNINNWNTSEIALNRVHDAIFSVTLQLYSGKINYKFLNGDHWGNEEVLPLACSDENNRSIYLGNTDLILESVAFGKGCNKNILINNSDSIDFKDFVLSSNYVYCVTEDHTGNIWVGTNHGLNRYNRTADDFEKYYSIKNDNLSLSENHISYLFVDRNDNLWIGTLGGGIDEKIKGKNGFISYTEENGLANNMVKGILEDNHGQLWITTNNGISKFNPESKQFFNYYLDEGFQGNNFRNAACLKRKNGNLMFGSINGFTVFNPDSFENTLTTSKVILTDLLLFNKTVECGKYYDDRIILPKSIQYTNSIKLTSKDKVISIQFTAIQYSTTDKLKFAYKLEGFDKEWHYTDSKNRTLTFTNLNGGNYVLYIKGMNRDGQWSDNPTVLKIYIRPPFWEMPIFIAIASLTILILVSFWIKFQIKSREKKWMREKMLAEQKVIQLEREQLKTEVEHKNKELASLTMYMINKTKNLSEQINKLDLISRQADRPTQERLHKLIEKLQEETVLEKDWEYFELHFDKVYQNFIFNLRQRYPELSVSDIRLAAYIRMSLSTKEIAELMNKSIRGVESSRYRLRQLLNMEVGENLADFLFKI